MAYPVAKAKYEELKTTYNTLQSRLREIESEMFDIGVQLDVLQAQLKESGEIPKTFDDRVASASRLIKPKSPFEPIKRRSLDMTPIIPHPIDNPGSFDSEANF